MLTLAGILKYLSFPKFSAALKIFCLSTAIIKILTALYQHSPIYVTWHEKIGVMCTQNLTTFLNFKLE